MWHYHDGMGWWMVFGMFWTIVFSVAVIWLVVWAVNKFSERRHEAPSSSESPLEIAKRRLARGEITTEQFEELKKALQ